MTDDGPIEALPAEEVTVDYLLTADFAEVINGKTYLMGAGWDRVAPATFPVDLKFGIGVGIRVPWLQTNFPHHLSVRLRSADGQELFAIEGDVETGRPPGTRGDSQLVPLAANVQIRLDEPQTLELAAAVDGRSMRRVTIRVDSVARRPTTRG